MAARIGIFLIAIIVLILLGQSVRNRTVLKYDPSTKQVIQVPKSELGNSVEVLRPASDIVVETPEEVETRFDNTLDELGVDKEAVKKEVKKVVDESCAFPPAGELGCYGNYEDDPNKEGCCKLKAGASPGLNEKMELAKMIGAEIAVGLVVGEAIEQGLKKASGQAGQKVSQKAAAKAVQEGSEKAAVKATQEGSEAAAKGGAAATKGGAAATKSGVAATKGGVAAAKGGVAAAKGGVVAVKTGATAAKGARVGVALAKGGAKMAAAGAKLAGSASKMAGGPVGAVMILFDIVSITLDILDVDGYNSYTSQDMIEKGKRAIDHGEYASIENEPSIDYPRLFPLYEFCPDEIGMATELMFMQMFEQYTIPNLPLDPVAGPKWDAWIAAIIEAEETGAAEPDLPSEILDFSMQTAAKYHKERDVFIYENLRLLLEPDRFKLLELVEWASSGTRQGITLSRAGASEWNTASRDIWLAHNDFFKPPPLELEYINPTAGVYTDRVYITNRADPGPDNNPNTIAVPFSELRTQHPQGELVFPNYPAGAKMVIAADYGGLVAFCTKRRQLSGVSTAIDPVQLGVTFDM